MNRRLSTSRIPRTERQRSYSALPRETRTPRRPSPSRPRSAHKPKYRFLPIILAGFLAFFALILFSGLIWATILFFTKGSPAEAVIIPLGIFLTMVFLSSYILSYILSGRHLLPILVFILLLNLFSLLLAGWEGFSLSGFLIKSAASLLCGLAAHALMRRSKQPRAMRY